MGGNNFTMSCTLSKNGYGIVVPSLLDTGANGFAFIDTTFAIQLAKFLNIKTKPLNRTIQAKGFDGKTSKVITHLLILNLTIDGHRQEEVPFLILDLGNHDLILGLKWMSYFNVWLNPKEHRIMWPDDPTRELPFSFHKEIRIPRSSLQAIRPHRKYQQNVAIRDRAMDLEDARRKGGSSTTI